LSANQLQQQQLSTSSNSLVPAAPLASSISVTSSLKSARPPTINHSVSWTTTTDTTKADILRVGRTVSLMNNDLRNRSNPVLTNEIERLKKRLAELEKEDLSLDSIYQQEYLEIQDRLKLLEEQQNSGGR
jgi:cell shape-determining protein MreC